MNNEKIRKIEKQLTDRMRKPDLWRYPQFGQFCKLIADNLCPDCKARIIAKMEDVADDKTRELLDHGFNGTNGGIGQ